MSNRRKLKKDRGPRCPKCRSRDYSTKEYADAILHVCHKCGLPRQVAKR